MTPKESSYLLRANYKCYKKKEVVSAAVVPYKGADSDPKEAESALTKKDRKEIMKTDRFKK